MIGNSEKTKLVRSRIIVHNHAALRAHLCVAIDPQTWQMGGILIPGETFGVGLVNWHNHMSRMCKIDIYPNNIPTRSLGTLGMLVMRSRTTLGTYKRDAVSTG